MSTELLEKYDCTPQKISTEEYISRRSPEMLLYGCIPCLSQELFFNRLSKNTGILLVGRHGVGKRTIDSFFANKYYAFSPLDEKPFEHYIKIPVQEFMKDGEDAACDMLVKLFDELRSYAEGLDDEDLEFCLVAFGDIKPIIGCEKTARAFAGCMSDLTKNGTGVCVVTAIYDGDIADIPWYIKRAMVVCRVDEPNNDERIKYFENQMDTMKSFVNNLAGIDYMAECTKGFSFDELNDIMRMLQIYLKAKFVEEENTEGDVSDLAISKVQFSAEEFKSIADNFKSKNQSSIDMSEITDVLSNIPAGALSKNQQSASEQIEERPKSPFDYIFSDDDPDDLSEL